MSKCYLLQPHLQRGEHTRFALTQAQRRHCSLQQHLTSSLQAVETGGKIIHFGDHSSVALALIQPKSAGEGAFIILWWLKPQRLA
jgi:hypothetical protein